MRIATREYHTSPSKRNTSNEQSQLKKMCRDSWLDEDGDKEDLIERLVDYEKPAAGSGSRSSQKAKNKKRTRRRQVAAAICGVTICGVTKRANRATVAIAAMMIVNGGERRKKLRQS